MPHLEAGSVSLLHENGGDFLMDLPADEKPIFEKMLESKIKWLVDRPAILYLTLTDDNLDGLENKLEGERQELNEELERPVIDVVARNKEAADVAIYILDLFLAKHDLMGFDERDKYLDEIRSLAKTCDVSLEEFGNIVVGVIGNKNSHNYPKGTLDLIEDETTDETKIRIGKNIKSLKHARKNYDDGELPDWYRDLIERKSTLLVSEDLPRFIDYVSGLIKRNELEARV